jgi:hypothetical protein
MDNEVEKPSLMRKISGGKLRTAPTLSHLKPNNESNEWYRHDSLKEEQSQNTESQPTKADLIDHHLSVEINKLGLGDRPISFSRLTTDQMR